MSTADPGTMTRRREGVAGFDMTVIEKELMRVIGKGKRS
jgi:hypothetical protein